MSEHRDGVDSLTLIPSGGGAFELTIDDKLVWSKKQMRKFPDYKDIAPSLG